MFSYLNHDIKNERLLIAQAAIKLALEKAKADAEKLELQQALEKAKADAIPIVQPSGGCCSCCDDDL